MTRSIDRVDDWHFLSGGPAQACRATGGSTGFGLEGQGHGAGGLTRTYTGVLEAKASQAGRAVEDTLLCIFLGDFGP